MSAAVVVVLHALLIVSATAPGGLAGGRGVALRSGASRSFDDDTGSPRILLSLSDRTVPESPVQEEPALPEPELTLFAPGRDAFRDALEAELPQLPFIAGANIDSEGAASGEARPSSSSTFQYWGQLTSRVQRAWTVPAAATARDFHCRVRILQGEDGALLELELGPCDSDPALRASIVAAIRGAAPLPERSKLVEASGTTLLDFTVFALADQGRRSSVQPGTAAL